MNTTHLSESEVVDLVEDKAALDPRRAAHVDTCASCRAQVDALRAILRDTAAVEMPEPSPLFWEHFAARVRDGVAAEPVGGRSAWTRSAWTWSGMRTLVPFAAAAALVIAVFSGALLIRAARTSDVANVAPRVADGSASAPALFVPGRPEATPDAENAEVWAVLTAAASDVEFEDAHDAGMHVQPEAIEHAVQDLTTAEMTELGRLLQSELKRSSN